MGTKTTNTTTSKESQNVAPPSWTMPGIEDASKRVIKALDTLPGERYGGNFVAQPNYAPAIAAYGGAAGEAGNQADFVQHALDSFAAVKPQFGINSPLMDTTGALPAAIASAVAPIRRQLMEQTLPGMRSSALDSGAYSNDRAMSILPELAIRDADRNQQEIASTLAYNDLQASADRRLQGFGLDTTRGLGEAELGATQQKDYMSSLPDLVDTIMRMRTGQGDIQTTMANLQGQQDQAGIDNATARNQYNAMYPFQGLDVATQLLARLSGNYGTTTRDGTSTNTQSTSGFGPILQGIMGAASLAGTVASGGMFPGGSGGGGGLAGSLFKNVKGGS